MFIILKIPDPTMVKTENMKDVCLTKEKQYNQTTVS